MGCGNSKNSAIRPLGEPNSASFELEDHNALTEEAKFIQHIVHQHNVYRKQHGNVGGLELNAEMSQIAQNWAQHLADMNQVEPSSKTYRAYRGSTLGENLAVQYSSDSSLVGMEAVTMWYDETEMYDYNNSEACRSDCGYFTQVVWKGSREIGVGRAFADNGQTVYVVCHYFPPGNVRGSFSENVLQKS